MIDRIYAESEALDYPVAKDVLRRFPKARLIECERYSEVFNRAGQNFRLQKSNPALILAVKHGELVLPAPDEYAVGGRHNYYFSHMNNCLYDCRYCFLQGMFRSAHYVLFVNYDDFMQAISQTAATHGNDETWFFSGYDCDSLALEPVSGFTDRFLPLFEKLPNAMLELRTKSTQVRKLRDHQPLANVITAFSFSTESATREFEHKVPSIEKRIEAMVSLQRLGWSVALRFDPLIWHQDWQREFKHLCEMIFQSLNTQAIHSICIGGFRMPVDFFKRVRQLYPRERLFAAGMRESHDAIGYDNERLELMREFAATTIGEHVSTDKLYFI